MRKQKKSGVLYTLFLVLLLIVVSLTGTSEAGVQLVPRVNTSGDIMQGGISEDYVVFGKYRHASVDVSNNYYREANPTPILWRVMSADAALGGQKRAILLSHYVLDAMAYQYKDNSGNPAERPDGQARNKWDGSEVQTWLNNTTTAIVTQYISATDETHPIKGFQHSDYFTTLELDAMLVYPDGAGSKVTLPSGFSEQVGNEWYDRLELGTWFGSLENTSNNNTRKAHFKGASFTYDSANTGWFYWTRSPASISNIAYNVFDFGELLDLNVTNTAVAVRPAFFLNLDSLLFKSASNDFAPGTPPPRRSRKNFEPVCTGSAECRAHKRERLGDDVYLRR